MYVLWNRHIHAPVVKSLPVNVRFIEQKITFFETNLTPDVSVLVIWDALKAYLREEIIAFTSNKKRLSQKGKLDLTSQVKEINQQYAISQTPELYNK